MVNDASPALVPRFDPQAPAVTGRVQDRALLLGIAAPGPLPATGQKKRLRADRRDRARILAGRPAEVNIELPLAGAPGLESEAGIRLRIRFRPQAFRAGLALRSEIDRGPASTGKDDARRLGARGEYRDGGSCDPEGARRALTLTNIKSLGAPS